MSGRARKAVILARGLGTRMKREDASARLDPRQEKEADSGVKAMIAFGEGRPFLDYILSGLADAGLDEACLVIGPEHDEIRRYYGRASPPRRARVSFAVQKQPLGTADAVLAAEEFAGDDDFLVVNSDNLYPVAALSGLAGLSGPGTALFDREALLSKSNIPAERIAAFAVCVVAADGTLESVIEKPDAETLARLGPAAPVSMNCWRFSKAIFASCRRIPLSPRGELELPMAVDEAIRSGVRFRVVRSSEGVLDLSQRSDVAAVEERLRGLSANP